MAPTSLGPRHWGIRGNGILIDNGANDNAIGAATSHNVISANLNGVHISGAGSTGNLLLRNFIGTDTTGTAALGNTGDGVLIDEGASGNTIGAAGSINVISGNNNGVHILGTGAGAVGSGTTGNIILNNYIGTDITGSLALGNVDDGILLGNGANANTIGNGAAAGANVVSGNGGNGVQIDGGNLVIPPGEVGTANNVVIGNLIGTDATGLLALGNAGDGVLINNGATGNVIGAAASHNVISGNGNNGVEVSGAGTTGNIFLGNYIGPDKSGLKPLGNLGNGVLIGAGAAANTVGGSIAGARNIISANAENGLQLDGSGTTLNNVLGNYIGTGSTGAVIMANALDGVMISGGASANNIGNGAAAGANVISGNGGNGVDITAGSDGNFVKGNMIGTGASGAALGDSNSGVFVASSNGNIIGGEAAGAGNVIQFNGGDGVTIASGAGQRDTAKLDFLERFDRDRSRRQRSDYEHARRFQDRRE